jgi:hypothetical protein
LVCRNCPKGRGISTGVLLFVCVEVEYVAGTVVCASFGAALECPEVCRQFPYRVPRSDGDSLQANRLLQPKYRVLALFLSCHFFFTVLGANAFCLQRDARVVRRLSAFRQPGMLDEKVYFPPVRIVCTVRGLSCQML